VTLFIQRSFLLQVVAIRMQVGDAIRDLDSLGIIPGTLADAVPRIQGRFSICGTDAQIGAPVAATCSDSRGQLLAVRVGPCQSAKICAVSRSLAGNEKTNRRLLVLRCPQSHAEQSQYHRHEGQLNLFHFDFLLFWTSSLCPRYGAPNNTGSVFYLMASTAIRRVIHKTKPTRT